MLENADGERICSAGRYLGEATNNVAEYEAVVWGLETARDRGIQAISLLCDSELVVRQLRGEYRVKNTHLKPLYGRASALLRGFASSDVQHVRREENTEADALVNASLDLRGPVGDVDARVSHAVNDQASLFDEGEPVVRVDRRTESHPSASTAGGTGVYELTVRGHFDAAHALRGYPGECRELHGHTWDVEITVEAEALDEIGIVYDFKTLKADLADVLAPYDHAYINEVPPFDDISPTAENLARVLYEALSKRVGPQVRVTAVAVWESPVAKLVYRP